MEVLEILYLIFDSENIRGSFSREDLSEVFRALEQMELPAATWKEIWSLLEEKYHAFDAAQNINDVDKFFLYKELRMHFTPQEDELYWCARLAGDLYSEREDRYQMLLRIMGWYEEYPGKLSVKTRYWLHRLFKDIVDEVLNEEGAIRDYLPKGVLPYLPRKEERTVLLVQKITEKEISDIRELLALMSEEQKKNILLIDSNDAWTMSRIPCFCNKEMTYPPEEDILMIDDVPIPVIALPGWGEEGDVFPDIVDYVVDFAPERVIQLGGFSLLGCMIDRIFPVISYGSIFCPTTAYWAHKTEMPNEDDAYLGVLLGTVSIGKGEIFAQPKELDKDRKIDVSIVLSAYNEEAHINRNLASLVMQTIGHERMEIICIDDASTDRTPQILKMWERRYPGLFKIILFNENSRAAKAYNTGLAFSAGKYLNYQAGDDWNRLDMMEELFEIADKYDVDMAGGVDDYRAADDGEKVGTVARNMNIKFNRPVQIDTLEERRRLVKEGLPCGSGCVLFRTSMLRDNDIYFIEGLLFHDNFFNALTMMYVRNYYIIDKQYIFWYANPNSITTRKNDPKMFDRLLVCEMTLDAYRERGFYEDFHEEIKDMFVQQYYLNTIYLMVVRNSNWNPNVVRRICKRTLMEYPNIKSDESVAKTPFEKELMRLIDKDPSGEEWRRVIEDKRREFS